MPTRLILLLTLFVHTVHTVAAQTTVSGVVRDSIAHRPLAGAIVQLAGGEGTAYAAHSATSDSLGRFMFSGIADGRYMIGFIHPLLDSLGIEPLVHEAQVRGAKPLRIDLATPAAARMRDAICGKSAADSGAALMGVVRDSLREPVADATVTAEWLEIAIGPSGFARRTARRAATTRSNGWFALCNVPGAGTMFLAAGRGAASSDQIEIAISNERFVRRELYLGTARTAGTAGTAGGDSIRRTGDGHLNGVVTAVLDGRPLPGAQVNVVGGHGTRANEHGEWTLTDAPSGTRMIEVRAIGYYPRRHAVDVIDGAPPVRIALSTMKAIMDTVRINAARDDLRRSNGFEERKRSTAGRFLTSEDVQRRNPMFMSDLFRTVPDLKVDQVEGRAMLTMRSMGAQRCAPAIYVDGSYMSDLEVDDLNSFVSPEEVAGIEIYSGLTLPHQFSAGNFGFERSGAFKEPCGAVVIWTKPSRK